MIFKIYFPFEFKYIVSILFEILQPELFTPYGVLILQKMSPLVLEFRNMSPIKLCRYSLISITWVNFMNLGWEKR